MVIESIQRLVVPQSIHFNEAIGVAVLGLFVNIISALLLQGRPGHSHGHHHDHNLKAAYLHVLADALTSLLAIIALVSGKFLGWNWLDPVMGLVGAAVITRWSYSLLRETSPVLLDGSIEGAYLTAIKKAIEKTMDNRIADIHVWQVGPAQYAAIISVVTHYPQRIEYYKELLRDFQELAHITIEVNTCDSEPCIALSPK